MAGLCEGSNEPSGFLKAIFLPDPTDEKTASECGTAGPQGSNLDLSHEISTDKAKPARTHRHDTTVHDVIRPVLYKNQSDSLMMADGDCHHFCKVMEPVRHRWSIHDVIGGIRNTVMPSDCSALRFGMRATKVVILRKKGQVLLKADQHVQALSHIPINTRRVGRPPEEVAETRSRPGRAVLKISCAWCQGPAFINHTRSTVLLENQVNEGNLVLDEQTLHFQQDGAPPHYALMADRRLPGKWIGRRGAVEWPARSPDLTPLDFFLWGHLKSVKTPILISKIYILSSKCIPGSVGNKVRGKLEQVLQRNVGLKDLRTASDIPAGKNTDLHVTFLNN
ncbi:hypothetical protein ANN_25692 [Periplaneta americana]|uniref:Uncharacterized protein n=1 Tax=Periplaneta americana TaxID=6978 RepID=A0ABQ8S3V8_PERAM|nr:hypothetical protein ANN_25692 [Periplaneta americana]